MQFKVHYDNAAQFGSPFLATQADGQDTFQEYSPTGQDAYGFTYEFQTDQIPFSIRFKDGVGDTQAWENESLRRVYSYPKKRGKKPTSAEFWARGSNAFLYAVEPRKAEAKSAAEFLQGLQFK